MLTILKKIELLNPKEIHLRLGHPPMIRKCPSSTFGNDWSFNGRKLLDDKLLNSVEYLSVDQINLFSKCTYCFGGEDDNSKLVRP